MRITEGLTYHVTEPRGELGGRSPFRLPDFSELHLLMLEMGFEDLVSFGPEYGGPGGFERILNGRGSLRMLNCF